MNFPAFDVLFIVRIFYLFLTLTIGLFDMPVPPPNVKPGRVRVFQAVDGYTAKNVYTKKNFSLKKTILEKIKNF